MKNKNSFFLLIFFLILTGFSFGINDNTKSNGKLTRQNLPDFVVKSISVDPGLMSYKFTIDNIGGNQCFEGQETLVVSVYCDGNFIKAYIVKTPKVIFKKHSDFAVPNPGIRTSRFKKYELPRLKTGYHFLKVKVDSPNAISEQNEENNVKTLQFYVGLQTFCQKIKGFSGYPGKITKVIKIFDATPVSINNKFKNSVRIENLTIYKSKEISISKEERTRFFISGGKTLDKKWGVDDCLYLNSTGFMGITSSYKFAGKLGSPLPEAVEQPVFEITDFIKNIGKNKLTFKLIDYGASFGSSEIYLIKTDGEKLNLPDLKVSDLSVDIRKGSYSFKIFHSSYPLNKLFDILIYVDSVKIYSIINNNLKSDKSKTIEYNNNPIPESVMNLKPGKHLLKVVVDPDNNISESDESNNIKKIYFFIEKKLPDFYVSKLKIDKKNNRYGFTLKNLGGTSDKKIRSVLFLDGKIIYDKSETLNEKEFIFKDWEEITKDLLPGNHTLAAWVDYKNSVEETDENNNYKTIEFTLSGKESKLPDLVVEKVWQDPDPAYLQDWVTLYAIVKNSGRTKTGEFIVEQFLGGQKRKSEIIKSLAPGEIKTVSLRWQLPFVMQISKQYDCRVDTKNSIKEKNELNNYNSLMINRENSSRIKKKPDLTILLECNKSDALPGETIPFTIKISNIGGIKLSENHYHKCGYKSLRVVFGWSKQKVVPGKKDIEYLTIYHPTVNSLSINESASYSGTIGVPDNIEGDYYLWSFVDKSRCIDESNENNNIFYKKITIAKPKPDLSVKIESPDVINPGHPISLKLIVKNSGKITAMNSNLSVCLILSKDSHIPKMPEKYSENFSEDSIVKNGLIYIKDRIDPGKTLIINKPNFNFMTTAKSGNYYLGAIIDCLNVIKEDNESNNIYKKRVKIQAIKFIHTGDSKEKKYQKISLKAYNNKFVCADKGLNGKLVANRDYPGEWEIFELIPEGGNLFSLKTSYGKYICADLGLGGRMFANRDRKGSWEKFEIIHLGGNKIALKNSSGKYVCADKGLGNILIANRNNIGDWEKFTIIYK